ncbi:hypothetical protein [Streptomyces sp. NPDC001070]
MPKILWQRPVALTTVALALAVGTVGAAQLTHTTVDRPATACSHEGHRGDGVSHGGDGGDGGFNFFGLFGGGSDGGDGGDAGAPGKPGQHGEPGKGLGAEPGRPGQAGKGGCAASDALPDKPENQLSAFDKTRIVLITVTGNATASEVAAKYKVPEDQVGVWKRQALQGDWLGLLMPDSLSRP